MIIQSLHRYYDRKRESGELAPEGFERRSIPFVVVLAADGTLVQIEDTRSGTGKQRVAREFVVPQSVKRSADIAANLLWDTAEYALGIDTRGKADRVAKQHADFVARVQNLAGYADDDGLRAVIRFLSHSSTKLLAADPTFAELAENNAVIAFRLTGDPGNLVCERGDVVRAIRESVNHGNNEDQSFCAVLGRADRTARVHSAIKGVWGAQSSGANIVSFNLDAFESFGRKQGANAPIGTEAAFTYTTALNHLLRKGSPQRMQVGDASTVFWSAVPTPLEDDFAAIFGSTLSDDPDRGTQAVRNLYAAVKNGVYVPDIGRNTEFYVLGLSPNAARIAVRFWHRTTVAELAPAIVQHLRDVEIDHPDYLAEHLSMFALLNATALLGRSENVPPKLAGEVFRSALTGQPYPAALLQAAVRRLRAERDVGYPRAAVIKACLNRTIRHGHLDAKELHVSLDPDNTDPGYRLGRLFAALERIQAAAQPGINATIRDRYYGAASSSPSSVFPVLLRLKNHHLGKLDNPRLAGWFEKTLADIFAGIESFPTHLSLPLQGMFAVGYYHQQQAFFTRRIDPTATDNLQPSASNQEPTP